MRPSLLKKILNPVQVYFGILFLGCNRHFAGKFHVFAALTESRDITEHLTPLKQRFDEIDNETDFAETEKHLVPLMDDICKVCSLDAI